MRIYSRTLLRALPLLATSLLCCAAGLAQAQTDSDAGDPPSRVARLSYMSGDLGLLPSGSKDWSDASVNRPLTTGDRLSTGQGGRAELELGGGSLRMAEGTDFGFLDLNDQMAQVELTQGSLNLAIRNLSQGQSYEIDTPTVALVVDQPGTFRVDVDRDGRTTEVTAFRGHAMVYGENNAQRQVDAGTRYEFGDSSLNNVTLSDMGGRGDAFDDWCYQRDQRYEQSPTRRYVSEEVVGYQDLDNYGDWRDDPDYGAVWYPAHVAVDWAPYRTGHWAYVGPWGWTWVDDSPWGFAPYHYGRWAYVRGNWGWVPGPIAVRPVYAPALVAFVGGNNWSVSIGIGGGAPVGWFPLGPREVYNPWYRASRNYYTNVNVTNINVHNTYNHTTIINNINNQYNYFRNGQPQPRMAYVNRDAPRGLTAMSGQNFASAKNVQRNLVQVDPHQLAAAPVLPRGIAIRPNQASFAPPRNPQARPLPAAGFQREVVARRAPPPSAATRPLAGPDNARPNRFERPAAIAAPTNVRLLNTQANPGRPAPGNTAPAAGNVATVPARLPPVGNRQMPNTAAQPPVPNAADMRRAEDAAGNRPTMRPNELPSARFAHPNANLDAAGREALPNRGDRAPLPQNQAPRPGVSYIPNAQEDRARAAQQAAQEQQQRGNLPDVPHYNRAQDNPQARNPRLESAPEQRPAPAAPRNEPVPQPRGRDIGNAAPFDNQRIERPAPRPAYQAQQRPEPQPRMEPQPQPQRMEQPMPRMREPQPEPRAYQPPPRPQPMPQNNPQPREQPHNNPPANRDEHRPRNKDEQHN
ncbi:DUF6600 domain-containing protein [Dyella koreensis]|uniref:FecR domain-containing protein n=1 Tax=Dyella koreensis TaxID=311235 RepID=A0ABW8K222_9GAMM